MPAAPPEQSLITYPCDFPIKVMGVQAEGFVEAVIEVTRRLVPDFDAATVQTRTSSGGRYLGVTLTIRATSRQQLDDLYRALSVHPMVKIVL